MCGLKKSLITAWGSSPDNDPSMTVISPSSIPYSASRYQMFSWAWPSCMRIGLGYHREGKYLDPSACVQIAKM